MVQIDTRSFCQEKQSGYTHSRPKFSTHPLLLDSPLEIHSLSSDSKNMQHPFSPA